MAGHNLAAATSPSAATGTQADSSVTTATGAAATSMSSSLPQNTPSVTGKPNTTTSSISPGEVAGIAIGAAIVGALLALLAIYIFMKRSKGSGGGRRRQSRDIDLEKSSNARPELGLEENLLERADDSEIKKSMQDLSELIDQHVENYYHLQSFEDSQGIERRLVECAYGTGPSMQEMASVLKNPKTRFAGIRQLIAMIIVRNIDFKARAEVSLLPPQIAAFCQCIPPVERQTGCEEVFDKAFTKWRRLSAFLLSPTRASRELPKANQRELQSTITQNVALINSIIKPFIKPGAEIQRYQEDNLSAIVLEGAQLGLLLFCQPSDWIFGWKASTRDDFNNGKDGSQVTTSDLSTSRIGAGRSWVVFPGIGESVERHGRQRVREVAAPVVGV